MVYFKYSIFTAKLISFHICFADKQIYNLISNFVADGEILLQWGFAKLKNGDDCKLRCVINLLNFINSALNLIPNHTIKYSTFFGELKAVDSLNCFVRIKVTY